MLDYMTAPEVDDLADDEYFYEKFLKEQKNGNLPETTQTPAGH